MSNELDKLTDATQDGPSRRGLPTFPICPVCGYQGPMRPKRGHRLSIYLLAGLSAATMVCGYAMGTDWGTLVWKLGASLIGLTLLVGLVAVIVDAAGPRVRCPSCRTGLR